MTFSSAAYTRVLSVQENQEKPRLIVPVRLQTTLDDCDEGVSAITIHTFALIDTGATKTCVCSKLLDSLQAQRWGQTRQVGISGPRETYYRHVNLALICDQVEFARFDDVEIIEYEPHEELIDRVLIGMDVLGRFKEIRIQGFALEFGAQLA
jgi:hypothetical protein